MVNITLNNNQKKALLNIRLAANQLVSNLEATMRNHKVDSPEFIYAKELLEDHKRLVETLYRDATTYFYDASCPITELDKAIRDIKSCSKEFLMDKCEVRISRMGY